MTLSLLAVPGLQLTSDRFKTMLVSVANQLGINPDHLAAVISFETAHSFSPSKKNLAGSGAVGLIQFMPSTAQTLGTSTEQLAAMTDVGQLEYVRRYFSNFAGRLHSLSDVYLAVLFPSAIGRKPEDIIFPAGSVSYEQNRGFDRANKGFVTVSDITSSINGFANSVRARLAFEPTSSELNPPPKAPSAPPSLASPHSLLGRADVVEDGDRRLRVLRPGNHGPLVLVWQKLLREIWPEEEDLSVNGRMDPDTVRFTREWQTRVGLPPDGIVGIMSWTRMLG
jgi:peptidoglycan hydrolase-like protein with peptidoglycan-binding domain